MSTQTKFKVGDRVATYIGNRFVGVVITVRSDGTIDVAPDGSRGGSYIVHPKQCRKLKPKSSDLYTYTRCENAVPLVPGDSTKNGCDKCEAVLLLRLVKKVK